jgi:hypothetical protein
MIHEAGHAAGLARQSNLDPHQPDTYSASSTVMQLNPIRNADAGFNVYSLGACDLIGLQMAYDLRTTADSYASCADHIPSQVNPDGLYSAIGVTPLTFDACVGQGISVSGRLAIKTTSSYGRLSDNPLTGRTVYFDRRPHGGSTWTTSVTSTTATNAGGNNWTRTFSTASSTNISYDFRAHFLGESNVDSAYSSTFTLSWFGPAC